MNLEPLELQQVMRTGDGFYIGRQLGDIGFNAFLGRPSPGPFGVSESWRKFRKLSFSDRREVVRFARAANVRLRDFLKKG